MWSLKWVLLLSVIGGLNMAHEVYRELPDPEQAPWRVRLQVLGLCFLFGFVGWPYRAGVEFYDRIRGWLATI